MDTLQTLVESRRSTREGRGRQLRERAGLSLREAARLIDVTPSTLSRWERGTRPQRGDAPYRYGELVQRLRKILVELENAPEGSLRGVPRALISSSKPDLSASRCDAGPGDGGLG